MIRNKKFRNKKTGEIVETFKLTEINNFEEVEKETKQTDRKKIK